MNVPYCVKLAVFVLAFANAAHAQQSVDLATFKLSPIVRHQHILFNLSGLFYAWAVEWSLEASDVISCPLLPGFECRMAYVFEESFTG